MPRTRVQLDVTDKQLAQLQKIKCDTDASTYAEVVKKSLRFYGWILDQKAAGRTIQTTDGKTACTVEVLML